MDRRLPISPIPNNLRKNLDSLKEPYSAEGYQGTKATDKDRTKDRTYHTRRDDDTVGNIKVDLKDNDSVIPYYFENVIKPTVVKEGNLIDVPLIYGGSEIWKTVQRDGYYRDKESKIQVPLIMFKRNTVTKRRDIGNKLDGNQAHLFQTFEKKYTNKNQYDNFDILNNRSPQKEYHAVVVPDYVTLTYDCIIWTEYVENMNKLVEAINFASDSYWGDPNRWKFKATIDSFQNQTEVTVGGNRIVRTTFTLTLNGYLIPDVYNKALANKTKFSSVTNIKFTDEQFTLQNAQTQPQPTISSFTTGTGAGGGSSTTFPFTGNAIINGSLTVIGSFVDFTGATGVSGSFSGSFVGDGSGLTGVTAEWDGSHLGDASITGSLTVTGGVSGSFSGSFVGDGSGLTGISTDTNIDKVYYVTPSGSDSTGIVGDLHQPFKTIGAARDKILNEGNSSTTLIHVFPGKYVEDEIQYQNGNFYFEPGAVVISPRRINGNSWGQKDGGITAVDTGNKIFTLGNYDLTTVYDFVSGSRFDVFGSTSNDGQYTIISSSGDSSAAQIFVSESIPSSTANGYIRDTTAIFKIGKSPLHSRLDSLTTDINIYGHGDFLVSQSIDPSAPDWNGSVVEVSSSIANVGFNFENIRAQQGIVVAIQKGTVNLTGKKIECTTLGSAAVNDGSGYSILLRGTEIFTTINVEEIVSYTSFALYLGNPFGGTAYINSQRITNNEGASTDTPIFIVGQQTGSKVYIDSQVIESNSNALNIQSNVGGELYVKANVNSGTGNNIVCLNNGKGGYPFDFTYEGNNVGNGYGVLTLGPSFSNGGGFTLNHIGKVFSKNSAAINWNGGTLNLTGDIIASGSNKRGVEVYSGDVNFNNTRIISTGDSIYSTSPQTVYAQTPLYIDTPFNSNIIVLGQYNYSGSSQHFSGPVSSSVFSGSFVGDGSGITGVTAEWDGSHLGDASITGSLTVTGGVSGSFEGDGSQITGVISSSYATTSSYAFYAVSASHEIIKEVSSSYADTASFAQSGNGTFSGSFSGSFEGDGNGLTNIPATGIVGLNLSQIASGSSTASISPNGGLFVNTNITASGNISSSGYISSSYFIGDGSQLTNLPLVTSASYALTASYVETAQTASYVLDAVSSSFSSFAISASYAVSASHEIIKEVSSSYADTASFAQSGNGIFSGSFSGSYVGDGSGLTNVTASFSPTASYALTASYVETSQTASYVETAQTASYIISSSIDGITDYIRNDQTSSMTVLSSSFALTSSYVETAQTASYVLEAISSSFSSFAISASYAVSASHEIIKEVSSSYADTASFAQSGNGIFSGSFSGSFTGVSPTSSYALTASYVETAQTASYVETAQTASYVLNAVSSSYALTASYAVSASHEIIKEVSSSYADTASFAQSGDGIFSGSFSGSYVGDGTGLTGVDAFPYSGSAIITGSLTVSGSIVDFTSASSVLLNIESIPLVNPKAEYVLTGAITSSGTTITLPNSLTYVSSSTYEYLEIYINGDRLRYNQDFIPTSTTSVQFQISIPTNAEVTYKSLKRP